MSTQKSSTVSKKDKTTKRKSAGDIPKSPAKSLKTSADSTPRNPTSEPPSTSAKVSAASKPSKSATSPAESIPDIPKTISATSKAAPAVKVLKDSDKSKKSKKAKAKEPSPSPEPEHEEEEMQEEGEHEEEDVHLHGFSTDDDSSDEEDDMDHEPSAIDISKLPTIAKDDASVKRKLEKAKRQPAEDRGVLFLGRIPHGFYEDQMRGYFSQFGNVTRVRLSRNKKTGRSKHYGFVEFDSSSVAEIVAETMDNYLLMGHILRCKVIPKDEVHPELWVGANRKWRVVPRDRLTRVEHNKERTEDRQDRAAKRLIKRQNARKRKLADAGIKYDFEAVGYKKPKEVKA